MAKLFNILTLISILQLNSCVQKEFDCTGLYELVDSSLLFPDKRDTLIIRKNKTYSHVLYSERGNCLIYQNNSKWEIENEMIILYDFRNDYFFESCICKDKIKCNTEFDAMFSPVDRSKTLKQVVDILAGIEYKRLDL